MRLSVSELLKRKGINKYDIDDIPFIQQTEKNRKAFSEAMALCELYERHESYMNFIHSYFKELVKGGEEHLSLNYEREVVKENIKTAYKNLSRLPEKFSIALIEIETNLLRELSKIDNYAEAFSKICRFREDVYLLFMDYKMEGDYISVNLDCDERQFPKNNKLPIDLLIDANGSYKLFHCTLGYFEDITNIDEFRTLKKELSKLKRQETIRSKELYDLYVRFYESFVDIFGEGCKGERPKEVLSKWEDKLNKYFDIAQYLVDKDYMLHLTNNIDLEDNLLGKKNNKMKTLFIRDLSKELLIEFENHFKDDFGNILKHLLDLLEKQEEVPEILYYLLLDSSKVTVDDYSVNYDKGCYRLSVFLDKTIDYLVEINPFVNISGLKKYLFGIQ